MSFLDALKGRGKHSEFPFSPGADENDADILDTLKKDHD